MRIWTPVSEGVGVPFTADTFTASGVIAAMYTPGRVLPHAIAHLFEPCTAAVGSTRLTTAVQIARERPFNAHIASSFSGVLRRWRPRTQTPIVFRGQ